MTASLFEQMGRSIASLKVRIVRHQAAADALRRYSDVAPLNAETVDRLLKQAGL